MDNNLPIEKILRNPPKSRIPAALRDKLQADLEATYTNLEPNSPSARACIEKPSTVTLAIRWLVCLRRLNWIGLAASWLLILAFRLTIPSGKTHNHTAGIKPISKEMWIVLSEERRAVLASTVLSASPEIKSEPFFSEPSIKDSSKIPGI